jgi:hypothetical protein
MYPILSILINLPQALVFGLSILFHWAVYVALFFYLYTFYFVLFNVDKISSHSFWEIEDYLKPDIICSVLFDL